MTTFESAAMLQFTEARRLLNVLDDALDKIRLDCLITDAVLDNERGLRQYDVHPEILSRLERLRAYREVVGEDEDAEEDVDSGMAYEIGTVALELTRQLQLDPRSAATIDDLHPKGRSEAVMTFWAALADLRTIVESDLQETADEEQQKAVFTQNIHQREQLTAANLAALQREYEEECEAAEEEARQQEALIAKMTGEIEEINQVTEMRCRDIQTAHDTAVQRETDIFKIKEQFLANKLAEVRKQYDATVKDTTTSKDGMIKRKQMVELEIAGVIAKYDETMLDLTQQIRGVQAEYDQKSQELAALQGMYDVNHAIRTAIIADKNLRREMEIQRRRQEAKENMAARVIQRLARTFLEKLKAEKKKKKAAAAKAAKLAAKKGPGKK